MNKKIQLQEELYRFCKEKNYYMELVKNTNLPYVARFYEILIRCLFETVCVNEVFRTEYITSIHDVLENFQINHLYSDSAGIWDRCEFVSVYISEYNAEYLFTEFRKWKLTRWK